MKEGRNEGMKKDALSEKKVSDAASSWKRGRKEARGRRNVGRHPPQ